MNRKKLIALLMAMLMVFSCMPSIAFADDVNGETTIVDSGTCGDNLTWELDSEGVLAISGTGEMKDYSYYEGNLAPWAELPVKALTFDDGITKIGDWAFSHCNELTGELIIPSSVMEIGNGAFYDCSGLTGDLVIPNTVKSIGESAFYKCCGFDGTLTLSESLTCIEDQTFRLCVGFTGDLIIPDSVKSIGELGFSANGTAGFDPDKGAFDGELVLPDGLEEIGGSAFYNAGFIGDLVIPNTVETIGGAAFEKCSGFDGELMFPNRLSEINHYTFSGCSGFTGDLVIPDSVNSIGSYAFNSCSGFNGTLTLPKNITRIEDYTFQHCSGLTGDLVIPNSVKTIGTEAFLNCSGFTGDLIIPDSVTDVGNGAFYNCSGFNGKLTLSKNLTEISSSTGYGEFQGCSGFTGELIIPESVEYIGYGSFEGCSGFTGDLIIPKNVKTILSSAFRDCSGLNGDLIISNSVTEIWDMAFYCCDFENIYIPDSVTKIGYSSFANNDYQKSRRFYVFKGSYADSNSSSFINTNDNLSYISTKAQGQKDYLAFKTSTIIVGATDDSESVELARLLISNKEITLGDDNVIISDPSIAAYSNGYIIGVFEGECDITVTIGNQECSAKLVVISDELPSATSFGFAEESLMIDKGTTAYNQIVKDPLGTDIVIDRWYSSDETVVTVDENGIITAVATGTATITAKAGDVRASYEVVVGHSLVGIYTLYVNDVYEMIKGEKENLRYYIYPFDTTDASKVTFESSNKDVVTITDDGLMEAVDIGTATIKVKKGDFEDNVTVIVNNPIKAISLDKTSFRAYVQDEVQLNLTCEPADHNDEAIPKWTSSDETIATVDDNGLVTIKSAGNGAAIVTITAEVKGLTASCKVTALPMVALEAIALDDEAKTLKYNEEFAFTVTKTPKNTTNKKPILWTSSDEDVVTVSENGTIKGVGVGIATITATVKDTKDANGQPITATCEITVEKATPEYTVPEGLVALAGDTLSDIELPEGFTWNDETADVGERGEKTFKATFTPEDTDNYKTINDIDISINVKDPKVTAISIKDTLELCVNRDFTLEATIKTQDDPEYTVTWSVEDSDIAEVDQNGKVLAKNAGETTVTVKTSDEMTASCKVIVNNHDYDAVVTKPTCTETGFTTYTCTACSDEYVADETDSLGHTEGAAATCTTAQSCTVCGEKLNPALDHDLSSHEGQAPTCTEKGWAAYVTCSRCDYTTYEEKAKLGHDEVSHEAKAPTCTEIGWNAYVTCSRCDYTTYEEKAKLGHDEVSHEAKAPTCTEIGWDAYVTCNRCDYTTYVEKAKLDHDYVDHEGKTATCDEPGWKAYQTCSKCDYTTYEAINALGHSYTNYIINNDSTCQKNATKTAICDNGCGTTDTRIAEGTMSNCRYGDWIIIKEPTKTEAGFQKRSCIWCGDTQTETIVATGAYVEINEENFPDPEFRRALINHYSQDEEGDDTILTPAELKEINRFYNYSDEYAIKDLTGIHLLTSLTSLDIACCTLIKHMPLLPDSLEEISCDEASVASFEMLPASLIRLSVQGGALKSLPELPEGLEDLWVSQNRLTSLPKLPKSLKSLSCWDNELTELPELPDGLEELNCDENKLKDIPKLPNGLKEFSCTYNELTSLQDLPDTVKWFRCYDNQLTKLPKLSQNLTELYAGYNQISGVLDVSDLEYLSILEAQGNVITAVKLCEDAPYKEIRLYDNAIKSLSDVAGGSDIPWDEDYDFQFKEQTKLCQIYGHSYEVISETAATCTKAGRIETECSVCGAGEIKTTSALGHSFGEYVTTDNAGFKKVGKKTATCATCQETDTQDIAAAVVPVIGDQTFNNKTKSPKVTVVNTNGDKVSSKATFATKSRKAVGKYKVTVKLTEDDYSGSKTVYFKINPKGVSLSKVTAGKKSFTAKWKKPSSTYRKQMTGYQIKYSTSSKMSKAKTVTVKSTKSTSKKISKLKAKKTYYVQLRTYKKIGTAYYYSSWSKVKKVKTK